MLKYIPNASIDDETKCFLVITGKGKDISIKDKSFEDLDFETIHILKNILQQLKNGFGYNYTAPEPEEHTFQFKFIKLENKIGVEPKDVHYYDICNLLDKINQLFNRKCLN